MQQRTLNAAIYETDSSAMLEIESRLRAHALVKDSVIVGERDSYYAALIVPDKAELIRHLKEMDPAPVYRLEGYHRLNDIDVRALFCDLLEEVNASRYGKRVERFALLESAHGKTREEICAVNRPIIDSLYQDYIAGIG